MDQSEAQSRTESIWKLLHVYFKETTTTCVLKKNYCLCMRDFRLSPLCK
jgi:hypothetical protein